MEKAEFLDIYSPLFQDLWKFFKRWMMDFPEGADWTKFADEVDQLANRDKRCSQLASKLVLACVTEVERQIGSKEAGS